MKGSTAAQPMTAAQGMTIGVDLGDRFSEIAIVNAKGEVVERRRERTETDAFEVMCRGLEGSRLVMEVGTHSPWASRVLAKRGFEVIVANAGRAGAILRGPMKTDRRDAQRLAQVGRLGPELLAPIEHRDEQTQRDLGVMRARDQLVRTRTSLIASARGLGKALGVRFPRCSADSFCGRVRAAKLDEQVDGLSEMLAAIDALCAQIGKLDERVAQISRTRYPASEQLRQVAGVGPITSMAFVLTIGNPKRFAKSRIVGAYLGLVPRQYASGDRQPQLGITKAGDAYLRRVLVQSAQYILGPHGPDTALKRHGLKIAERGGKNAKKRAVIAVARKLAVVLHRLWITGDDYRP